MQVTRETIIGDILDMDQTTAPYFMEIGMHCLGCPASRGESIEEACAVHGVDCDELIEKLNEQDVYKRQVRESGPREKATPTGRRQSCPGCALACRMAAHWRRKSIVY